MKLIHGAYILARYSTDNQEADSIEVQVSKCREWCSREGLPVLDVFADAPVIIGLKTLRLKKCWKRSAFEPFHIKIANET